MSVTSRLDRAGLPAVAVLLNVLLLPFALQGIHFDDTDTFYHLAGGRWMLEHGRVLDHEPFSFVRQGQAWTNYYWGFEVLVAAAERRLGLTGVVAVRALFVLATANLMLVWLWRLTRGWPLATLAFTLLGTALYMSRALNVRPHLASHLLLLALLVRLDRWVGGRRSFDPVVPLLFVAWANLHGVEYPVGLAVLVLCLGVTVAGVLRRPPGEALRDPVLRTAAALGLTSVGALLLNPFGAALLLVPLVAADPEMMHLIGEMAPVAPASLLDLTPELSLTSQLWLNVAVLAGVAVVPTWWRRRDALSMALFALGVALALNKLRFRPEAGILIVPLLARAAPAARERAPRWVAAGLATLAAVLVAGFATTAVDHVRRGFLRTLDLARHPVAACRTIEAHGLGGNAMVDPALAGYVSWCAPSVRVFMDMRSPDPFPGHDFWLARAAGLQVPWATITARWPLDLLLLHAGSPQAVALLGRPDPGFLPISADGRHLLFLRAEVAAARGLGLRYPAGIDGGDGSPAEEAVLRAEAERQVAIFGLNPLANETLARLDLAAGRSTDVLARVRPLRSAYPRDATWPWLEGLALAGTSRLADAAQALHEARRLSPASPRVASDLVRVLLQAGAAEPAVAVMEQEARNRLFLLDPDEYTLLGRAREAAGQPVGAADAYSRALWLTSGAEAREPTIALQLRLAVLQLELGRPQEALGYADAALVFGAGARARLARGNALAALGRRDEARQSFEAAAADPAAPPEIVAAARAALAR